MGRPYKNALDHFLPYTGTNAFLSEMYRARSIIRFNLQLEQENRGKSILAPIAV
jgi:hypothetical protein